MTQRFAIDLGYSPPSFVVCNDSRQEAMQVVAMPATARSRQLRHRQVRGLQFRSAVVILGRESVGPLTQIKRAQSGFIKLM
jgi:hypothetical protein